MQLDQRDLLMIIYLAQWCYMRFPAAAVLFLQGTVFNSE